MDNKTFDLLLKSVQQMDEIEKGEREPSRVTGVASPEDLAYLDRALAGMRDTYFLPINMMTASSGRTLSIHLPNDIHVAQVYEEWGQKLRAYQDEAVKYFTRYFDMSMDLRDTHLRGRFIHQHKGKKKRQHRIKNSYVKEVKQFTNCWPSGSDLFDTADQVLQYRSKFSYKGWADEQSKG